MGNPLEQQFAFKGLWKFCNMKQAKLFLSFFMNKKNRKRRNIAMFGGCSRMNTFSTQKAIWPKWQYGRTPLPFNIEWSMLILNVMYFCNYCDSSNVILLCTVQANDTAPFLHTKIL